MDSTLYGIDATNAGQFSLATYDTITTDPSGLIPGWSEDTKASQNDGTDQVRVFFNDSAGVNEIVMAFRGTANLGNWKDDFRSNGQDAYGTFFPDIVAAYDTALSDHPSDKVFVDGHSLGGGLAQDFAVTKQLDGYGQNSLPFTNGTIDDVNNYRASGHQFVETNVAGDPATLLWRNGLYLDPTPTNLRSIFPALEVAGMTAAAVAGPLGMAFGGLSAYLAHSIKMVNFLSNGYELDPITHHLDVPSTSPNISDPASIWFLESFAENASVTDNGDGTYVVSDLWDNRTTLTVSGIFNGDAQDVNLSGSVVSSVIGDTGWSGTLNASMTNSDASSPIYSISENESNSRFDDPDGVTYTFNADGSFNGQYSRPADAYESSYNFSLSDPSTGIITGNGGDGPGGMLGYGYTYNPDGTSSGSPNGGGSTGTVTGQFSIASDGSATWDESVVFTDGTGIAYTDNWSTPIGGGYDEQYADSSGSWEYAQNADGVETV